MNRWRSGDSRWACLQTLPQDDKAERKPHPQSELKTAGNLIVQPAVEISIEISKRGIYVLVWTLCIMHRCVTSTMFGSCFWFFKKLLSFQTTVGPHPRPGPLPHRPPQEWRHIREAE
jgi:hypothetical protein